MDSRRFPSGCLVLSLLIFLCLGVSIGVYECSAPPTSDLPFDSTAWSDPGSTDGGVASTRWRMREGALRMVQKGMTKAQVTEILGASHSEGDLWLYGLRAAPAFGPSISPTLRIWFREGRVRSVEIKTYD